MLLTGSTVSIGDKLFHITLGWGTVTAIKNGNARIQMDKGNRILNMKEGGMTGSTRTFYWANPIVRELRQDEIQYAETASSLFDLCFSHIKEAGTN
jgi:hypothetical protein